ncbi:hypothetical protein [Ferrovibrio sp.]|uniref:hypothetical protein n=1 Tax=Ferrovibrio sp. TaxID=1917215 RepID=UPI003D0EFAEF
MAGRTAILLILILAASPLLAQASGGVQTPSARPEAFCALPATAPSLASGSLSMKTEKNWQPPGGHIDLLVDPRVTLTNKAQYVACFQWRDSQGNPLRDAKGNLLGFGQPVAAPVQITKLSTTNTFELRVTIPALQEPTRSQLADHKLSLDTELLVPRATLRLIAIDMVAQDDKTFQQQVVVDTSLTVGIQSQCWAVGVALFLVLVVVIILTRFGKQDPMIAKANWLLRLISTDGGNASLSQFQIMLWTFVVGFSAVYVMVLSGSLIVISASTLGLLGIAGAATLLAQYTAASTNPPAAGGGDPSANVPPGAALADPAPVGATRTPHFSDLIKDTASGATIDVTRLQMLLFTLICAGFVLIKVLTGHEIPEIPDGYLILMGLSNGVYIGSKNIQKSAAQK